jgi:hypothetical protein
MIGKHLAPLSRRLLCLGAVAWPLALSAAGLISNPAFLDANADGKPEGWEIKTYVIETNRGTRCLSMKILRKDKSSLIGQASTIFQGPEGYYRVTVSYLDEKDGVSKAKLLVNGAVIHIWDFDGTFGDCWRDEVVENVALKPGDTLLFWGRDSPSEYCRIRSITVAPSPTPPTLQEIEEREHPPVVPETVYGPLVSLGQFRDLSAEDKRPEYRPLIMGPMLFLGKGREKTELELTLNQPRDPRYSLAYLGPEATGREKGEPLVADAELAYDPGTDVAVIRPPSEKPGLYSIRGPNGYWASDVPHVLAVETQPKDNLRSGGTGPFYFFVPKGTKAFGVGGYSNGGYIAEVAVRAPDGSLVTKRDVPHESPQGILIRVRPGQDDRAWSVTVSGVSPRIRLCGVPPYLATHPRYLLVPRECLTPQK